MNLAVLKKSRRGPEAGDIFVMLPRDQLFLYGRVISTEAKIGPMENCVLIYIYTLRSTTKLPVPELSRDHLLVPPIMTNKLPWRRGYFETVDHQTLEEEDRLRQHCFKDLFIEGKYFDESSNELDQCGELVGVWGLGSFRTIDDEVSEALGLPLSD